MRAFRSSDLFVPMLWGGVGGTLAGLAVGRGTGRPLWGLAVGLAVVLAVALWRLRRPMRRVRLAKQAFPPASREWLERHVGLYRTLGDSARQRFERDVIWLLDALRFEGVGGVEATPTLRLAVAAGAAVMLHGRPDWELPTERTVLFVPDAFDAAYGDEEDGVYDGMVHAQGPIVLAASAVEAGWRREDGQNVVLHELAHVFDFDGWDADGVPAFLDARSADAWRTLMRAEMWKAQTGKGILRSYAASAPAELFAVATEQFFERPARLRARHPELFEALVAFYAYEPPDEDIPVDDRGSLMERRWRR